MHNRGPSIHKDADIGCGLRSDGLWLEWLNCDVPKGCPALFLDRDGVLNIDAHFVYKAEHLKLIEGAAELIGRAKKAGHAVIIVTNQSGIGRGYYDWVQFSDFQRHLIQCLHKRNSLPFGGIDMVLACPYHPEAKANYQYENHPWRKPNPGMLLEAVNLLNSQCTRSVIVGDRISDMQAGYHARLGHGILFNPQGRSSDDIISFQTACMGRFSFSMIQSLNEIQFENFNV